MTIKHTKHDALAKLAQLTEAKLPPVEDPPPHKKETDKDHRARINRERHPKIDKISDE
jgi:hypothetical protein